MRLLCTRYAMRILHPLIVHRHGGGEGRNTPALTIGVQAFSACLIMLHCALLPDAGCLREAAQ